MKWPSHHVNAITKSKSHPGMKLAPVRVFSGKHPLRGSAQGKCCPGAAAFLLVELLLGYMLQPTSSKKHRLFGGKKGLKSSFKGLGVIICWCNIAWENSRHLATVPLVSPPNDVWEMSAEIPYSCCVTLLIGRAAWEIWFNQSQALPRSG